jgi:phage head maturation protease
MSTAETTHMTNTETAARPFLVREFVARDLEVEGRTVDVRLVPFGEVARVADPPDWHEYDEEWLPGCFDHQVNAANRIHAKYGHSESVVDVVGHGITLRSVDGDGYHVSTKIHETIQGETTLELLRGGALPCVSLEARPVKSIRSAAGVVQRVKAHLTGFAFCRQGAFTGAQVLAVREEIVDEVVLDPEFLPVPIDPELLERCRRLGLKVPQRYEAHPAETDTPAQSGTSEDGTRQTEAQADTEE